MKELEDGEMTEPDEVSLSRLLAPLPPSDTRALLIQPQMSTAPPSGVGGLTGGTPAQTQETLRGVIGQSRQLTLSLISPLVFRRD
jgi:hypothetical protein